MYRYLFIYLLKYLVPCVQRLHSNPRKKYWGMTDHSKSHNQIPQTGKIILSIGTTMKYI